MANLKAQAMFAVPDRTAVISGGGSGLGENGCEELIYQRLLGYPY